MSKQALAGYDISRGGVQGGGDPVLFCLHRTWPPLTTKALGFCVREEPQPVKCRKHPKAAALDDFEFSWGFSLLAARKPEVWVHISYLEAESVGVTQLTVVISNCNSVDRAEISVLKGTLNIKYGPNGLGKSTLDGIMTGDSMESSKRNCRVRMPEASKPCNPKTGHNE
ncbi:MULTISPECIES: hypothetical protein [unclassified Bradyrhizobium]